MYYYYYCSLFYSMHLAWTLLFFPNKLNCYFNFCIAALTRLHSVHIKVSGSSSPHPRRDEEEEPSAVCCATTRGHTFPLLARTQTYLSPVCSAPTSSQGCSEPIQGSAPPPHHIPRHFPPRPPGSPYVINATATFLAPLLFFTFMR